jgi:hypothetical protein
VALPTLLAFFWPLFLRFGKEAKIGKTVDKMKGDAKAKTK